jgi:hypothetical protein
MEHQGPTEEYVGPADFFKVFEQFYILVDGIIAGKHGNERLTLGFFAGDLDISLAFFKSHVTDFLLAKDAEDAFIDIVPDIVPDTFFVQFF